MSHTLIVRTYDTTRFHKTRFWLETSNNRWSSWYKIFDLLNLFSLILTSSYFLPFLYVLMTFIRYTFGGVNVHQTLNRNYLYKLLNFIKVIYVRCNRTDQDNLSLQWKMLNHIYFDSVFMVGDHIVNQKIGQVNKFSCILFSFLLVIYVCFY